MKPIRSIVFAGALMAATIAGAAAQDYAYADSYGNLVIESAAGYKRILVGRGHDAVRVNKYLHRGQAQPPARPVAYRDCYRPGVFVKGRSYMYGLSDGEMPVLAPCR